MKKRNKLILMISIVLIILIIILVINITNKTIKQEEADEDSFNTSENIKLADEDIIYVDLTQSNYNGELASSYENEEEVEDESRIDEINNNYYNINIDISSKTVVADDTEFDIDDFFNITEDELNELLDSEDKILEFLQENMTGDIEYSDGEIQIENSYSTNAIMIKCSNVEDIQNYGEAELLIKVATDVYCVKYNDAYDTKEGYEILNDNNSVENVCKDYQVQALDIEDYNVSAMTVSDESYYNYGILTTGLYYYEEKINYSENENEILVAVLDTGIYEDHEVFANEETADRIDYTYSYNYVDESSDISDDNGHGTSVAGIIAEGTSNNVKIVPIKLLDSSGSTSMSTACLALADLKGKIDIINMSFGYIGEVAEEDVATYEEVLQEVSESDSLLVCAAGNYSSTDSEENKAVAYPASSEYTIAVSATDYYENISDTDSIADYSACGEEIDFSAPGTSVYVPTINGTTEYEKGSGTSYSTPLITSAFALLKSENVDSSTENLIELLKTYCTDLGDEGWDKYFGYGCIDFGSLMFQKPVIVMKEISDEMVTESATVTMEVICSNNIAAYSYFTEYTEDLTWTEISEETNIYELELTFSENGDYYIYFKDDNENIVYIIAEITNISTDSDEDNTEDDNNNEETKETYTLYLYDGTTLISSISITEGDTITISDLETVTKDGYTLAGWVDSDGNFVTGTITVTGDITLYTSWTENETEGEDDEDTKETYILYLYDGEDLYSTQEIKEGDYVYISDLPELTQSGYTFNGWVDTEGNIIENNIEVTGDIYLYASWTEEEENTITTPVNSNFNSATCEWIGRSYYTYSDGTETKTTTVLKINNILRYISDNDSYKYYYYISNSQSEVDIEDWVEIKEEQTSSDSLELEINFDDISNYDELDTDADVYIYIKEIAIKDENESTIISDPILVNQVAESLVITIYLDDEVYFTATINNSSSSGETSTESSSSGTTSNSSTSENESTTSSNTSTNASTTNSSSTTSTSSLPYTGAKTLLIGGIAVFVVIAVVVRKKWNDLKGI